MMTIARLISVSACTALMLAGCGGGSDSGAGGGVADMSKVDMGPSEYDAGGTMPCSAGSAAFDEACGYRVVRDGAGGAEIWISNIASDVKPAYRVLIFSNGEFSARDGSSLDVSKEGDMWVIAAADGGHFRFADAVITGG